MLLIKHSPPKHKSARDERQFYSACHRGYEKAQRRIIETIVDLRNDEETSVHQSEHFELYLRRVIDSIAYTIFGGEIHIIRRFVLKDSIANLNMDDILAVQKTVDQYNSESRLSFALLADLSTYIQVGDIIRIDFREGRPRLNIIEVKAGKVNHLLNDFLDRFQNHPGSLEAIKECQVLKDDHRKQAHRMMKQRIRMSQLQELIATDEGTDIKTGHKITFPAKRIETASYGPDLSELCDVAMSEGRAGIRIDETIHAIAYQTRLLDEDPITAQSMLLHSLIESRYTRPEIKKLEERMLNYCEFSELFRAFNPIRLNSVAMACTPCQTWPMDSKHINSLLCGKLQLLFAFDAPGFIQLVQDLGGEVTFSSGREADKIRKELGTAAGFSWGGKYMVINGVTQLGGNFSRIINDLSTPNVMIKGLLKQFDELKQASSSSTKTTKK